MSDTAAGNANLRARAAAAGSAAAVIPADSAGTGRNARQRDADPGGAGCVAGADAAASTAAVAAAGPGDAGRNAGWRSRIATAASGQHGGKQDLEQEAPSAHDGADCKPRTRVENLGGWLTTVVARVCLDMLRSRKSRGEEPLAAQVPEPAATDQERIDPHPASTAAAMAEKRGTIRVAAGRTTAPAAISPAVPTAPPPR